MSNRQYKRWLRHKDQGLMMWAAKDEAFQQAVKVEQAREVYHQKREEAGRCPFREGQWIQPQSKIHSSPSLVLRIELLDPTQGYGRFIWHMTTVSGWAVPSADGSYRETDMHYHTSEWPVDGWAWFDCSVVVGQPERWMALGRRPTQAEIAKWQADHSPKKPAEEFKVGDVATFIDGTTGEVVEVSARKLTLQYPDGQRSELRRSDCSQASADEHKTFVMRKKAATPKAVKKAPKQKPTKEKPPEEQTFENLTGLSISELGCNEHGVFLNPETIKIPLPITWKIAMLVRVAESKAGTFHLGWDFEKRFGNFSSESVGASARNKYDSRREALAAASTRCQAWLDGHLTDQRKRLLEAKVFVRAAMGEADRAKKLTTTASRSEDPCSTSSLNSPGTAPAADATTASPPATPASPTSSLAPLRNAQDAPPCSPTPVPSSSSKRRQNKAQTLGDTQTASPIKPRAKRGRQVVVKVDPAAEWDFVTTFPTVLPAIAKDIEALMRLQVDVNEDPTSQPWSRDQHFAWLEGMAGRELQAAEIHRLASGGVNPDTKRKWTAKQFEAMGRETSNLMRQTQEQLDWYEDYFGEEARRALHLHLVMLVSPAPSEREKSKQAWLAMHSGTASKTLEDSK